MRKAIGLIVLVFLLALLGLQFDISSSVDSIKRISILHLAGLAILQIFTQTLINYQWYRIGKVIDCPMNFWNMLYINSQGNIMEAITPGAKVGGELARVYLIKKDMGYSTDEAIVVVAIQKMVSLTAFFGLNLLAILHISRKIAFLNQYYQILYLFLIPLVMLMSILLFVPETLISFLKERYFKWGFLNRLREFLLELLVHGAKIKEQPLEWWKQFGLALFIWLLFPVKLIILMHAFGGSWSFLLVAGITFISYMMGMIPLLPGGLGSFEATMTGLLLLIGLPMGHATAMTLVFRFITFWFVVILSLFFVALWKLFFLKGTEDEYNQTTA